MTGRSDAGRRLEELICRVATFDCPVLITGETGCGKEEVARAIHAASSRRDGPFVSINCGGLVAGLAESHFFGHEKGAFTGAVGASLGGFRAANGGIVFLDEIGEMQLENGLFREDLLYRINTIHISIPPLRARAADIPAFIEHFSAHFAQKYTRPLWQPEPGLLERLVGHSWPGNIRQLAQVIQRLYVFEDRQAWVLDQLFENESQGAGIGPLADPADQLPRAEIRAAPLEEALSEAVPLTMSEPAPIEPALPTCNLAELRRLAVRQALAATDGHRGRAADLLGVSLNTMTKMVTEACPEMATTRGRKPAAKPR
jgi:DNA-binding NtrC family response regulator